MPVVPPWQHGPPPVPPSSALSAPANLQPVRNVAKPKRTGALRPSPGPGAGGVFAVSDDGSMPNRADASTAFAAQEIERQQHYLQQLDLRQEQALRRLGAGGPAYDRLSAQGMPMP